MMHANLMNNYFNPNSVYTEEDFKHRFQMRCHAFERLLRDVQHINPYFRQKWDRAGRPDEYLCEPNQEDMNRLLCKAENCGFPGIIGSLDCMHWDWKNCPTGWQ
ncbi:hypothetical protein DVH24_008454 [Malus domestica]|uniref:Uncharacterized protein n=1 Tax=Malus domestica TaxID=3750 RepID=A0A498JQ19_MALDO|nr:hypothetical protein DVH24_008454 [Malus domestica]